MKHHWFVPEGDCDGTAIVYLPGRGGSSNEFIQQYCECLDEEQDEQRILIGIDPDNNWYPQPYGPEDQADAVAGCEKRARELNDYLSKILIELHVQPRNVVLVGFSAGAVIAIQAASEEEYAGVICHNGCVLDCNILGYAPITVRLYHAQDDQVFSWEERYLPTKSILIEFGYNVTFKERDKGGHNINPEDMKDAVKTIRSWLKRT